MPENGETMPSSKSRSPSGELNVEAIQTTHRILGEFGRDDRTFDILHADLYDPRPEVVISALWALGTVADPRSFSYVAKLLSQQNADIVCASVKALVRIAAPKTLPFLLKLANSRREESVQLEVLRALAASFPASAEARKLAAALSHSPAVQPETRSAALETLIQLQSRDGAEGALALAVKERDGISSLLQVARHDAPLADAALAALAQNHVRLPMHLRVQLIALAAPLSTSAARDIFLQSLADVNPAVRRECYRRIGTLPAQVPQYDALCTVMREFVESDASLEGEALLAMDAMEAMARASGPMPELPSLAALPKSVSALFESLQGSSDRDVDMSSEMGWQIAHAKEYIEYYFDEDAKKLFLLAIKSGGGPAERQRATLRLKESAVKLEACHFEGYGILHELLADPTRSGIALFIRHLSTARTEKRDELCRLKRGLSLFRLAPLPGMEDLLVKILDWSRKQKLFRLAEQTLFALNRADQQVALVACRECMRPPVKNKMLAIAAMELVKDQDPATMEPTLINLFHENDRYIRLALLDTLSTVPALGENLLRAILQLFCSETDNESASRLADLLGAKADSGISGALIDVYDRFEEWKRILAVSVIHRIAQRSAPDTAVIEFVYRVLRTGTPVVIARIPATLIALGDDYAPRVLSDVLGRLSSAERITLVRDLRDHLKPAVIAVIWSLMREEDKWLQEALRFVLPLTSDPRAQQLLVSMVRVLRMPASDADAVEVEPVEGKDVKFSTEKETYRFEREHVRACAVLFSDIQDYSRKAQELSAMQITDLLQEYEGILLPIVDAHEGTLVKRMGDGHLFLFSDPLASVLAAIRVQKALRRFNRFRPEIMRVVVRIGVHWGEVVEKGGDALGNTVNIASRLQSVARGGSTCISQELIGKVSDWIHANDLGMIEVKGLKEAIHVWEPIEIVLDIPAERDPLKRGVRREATAAPAAGAGPDRGALDGFISGLEQALRHLRDVCEECARSAEDASRVKAEFDAMWRDLKPSLSSLGGLGSAARDMEKEEL